MVTGALAVGIAAGAMGVNLAGYAAMQDTVQEGIREMRARALGGDQVAVRAFSGLCEYIHSERRPHPPFFAKGMHIYDEGFWDLPPR